MYWCTFTEDKEISAATKFGKLHSLKCSNQTEIMHCVFHWSTQYHLVVRSDAFGTVTVRDGA